MNFMVSRHCELSIDCKIAYHDEEVNEKEITVKLKELASKYKNRDCIDVTVNINDLDEDEEGKFANTYISYSYDEECSGSEGRKSRSYYEEDEPVTINADGEELKEEQMMTDIEDAISEAGFDCFYIEVYDNNIDSLDKLYENHERSNEPDYERD